MSEEWEIWYYKFIYMIMPEDMADEYWRFREIRKDFGDLTQ